MKIEWQTTPFNTVALVCHEEPLDSPPLWKQVHYNLPATPTFNPHREALAATLSFINYFNGNLRVPGKLLSSTYKVLNDWLSDREFTVSNIHYSAAIFPSYGESELKVITNRHPSFKQARNLKDPRKALLQLVDGNYWHGYIRSTHTLTLTSNHFYIGASGKPGDLFFNLLSTGILFSESLLCDIIAIDRLHSESVNQQTIEILRSLLNSVGLKLKLI
ncbi:MAG: hypothetical protein Q4P66_08770 [Actinomycetaceae bacterium]|nr:hypothetical protein [Actinomycetaceae bacterium]